MKKLRSDFAKRQYMVKQDFEVYYYSDVSFQNVQPHAHGYYEFYFPVSDGIDMEIGGKKLSLNRNCAVLVPPKIMHRALNADPGSTYRRFVFWMSSSYFHMLMEHHPDTVRPLAEAVKNRNCVFRFTENEMTSLHAKITRLVEETREERYGGNEMADLCIRDLLLSMCRMIREKQTPAAKSQDRLKLQDILQYIDRNLDEDLSLDDLAGVFFVSKYYIAHRFRERMGISVHQYILKKRLEQCAASIAKGNSITKTYTEFGFRDYASFYRAFRREYGISPKEYQEASA